jgi:hypothetical protein
MWKTLGIEKMKDLDNASSKKQNYLQIKKTTKNRKNKHGEHML